MYDVTAGNVEIPLGMGKLVEFDEKGVHINAESVRN